MWQYDSADYRYLAEHFWGVAHDPATYHPAFSGHWGFFLTQIPFREIGTGTHYLLCQLLYSAFDANPQPEALPWFAPTIIRMGLVAAYAFVFLEARKAFGMGWALLVVLALAFPTQHWAMTDSAYSEALARTLFVLALGQAIHLAVHPWTARAVFWFGLLGLLLVHVKSQWMLIYGLTFPAMVYDALRARTRLRLMGLAAAFLVAMPLSLQLVHWVGWGAPVTTIGVGMHVNLKWDGAVVAEARENRHDGAGLHLADEHEVEPYWRVSISTKHSHIRADLQELDHSARDYLIRDWRTRIAAPLWTGISDSTNFPEQLYKRKKTLRTFYQTCDWIIGALLVVGLAFRRSRIPCALVLSFALAIAVGNVFGAWDPRYHDPFCNVALVAALLVTATLATEIWVRGRGWERIGRSREPALG